MPRIVGVVLLPAAVVSFRIAAAFPETIESVYAQRVYPAVASLFGFLNRARFSLAEALLVALLAATAFALYRARRPGRIALLLWAAAGITSWAFLVLWGFNYARPSLGERMGLERATIGGRAVLRAGRRSAELTSHLYDGPGPRPTLAEIDREVDRGYAQLRLPGDALRPGTTPAKPLSSSLLFSYLGISGIFIPFTGEPSINALQPDVSLPLVVAHEKAHQRGITHEGEANFAAFLVCSRADAPRFLRYSAYLFATRHLLGEASFYLPEEEIRAAWDLLGEGPRSDVARIREFWRRYAGPASAVASLVNDGYLKTMRVPEGVESYGTVVRLLVALDEEGALFPEE